MADTHDNAHGTTLAAPELAHHDVDDLAPPGTAAARAVVTPTSEKAPDAANVEGPVQTETQRLIFEQPADDGKRFATLRAHLALAGWALSRTAAGDGPATYYATRWGKATPELASLDAVAEFADRVGAR